MAERCPNAELCCICKEPSHRVRFCHFSWYRDVSPTSSPAPQCQDTCQDTRRDTPLVANPRDPLPSSVPPSDSQSPSQGLLVLGDLFGDDDDFASVCSNTEVTSSDDDCADDNGDDNDDEDDDTDGDDDNDNEDDDDNDGGMSASAGPVPVSLGTPVSASWDVTVLQPPYLGWGRSQPP